MKLPRPRPGYPLPYAVGMCAGTAVLGIAAAVGFGSWLALGPRESTRVLAGFGLAGAAVLLAVAGLMCVYGVFGKPYRREVHLPWQRRRDDD
jgi:hypothetical protein